MRARVAALSPRAQAGLAAGAVLLLVVAFWFVVVSPKRAEAGRLADDLAAAELELSQRQAAVGASKRDTSSADVFKLARAMPSSGDQAGLLLELDRLARISGLTLISIAVQESTATPGTTASIPVVVTADGSYRQIVRFLGNARELVKVKRGKVRAKGRLLAVEDVALVESKTGGFPRLEATIALSAYVYDGPIVPEVPVVPAGDESGDGSSSQPTAAGATP